MPGTLGYYYSTNNTTEPNTPATQYPYSLVEPSLGPLGGVRRAAGPGEAFHMGSGHESRGREIPLLGEFDQYLTLRHHFVAGHNNLASLRQQGTKSVSIDADGRESVIVANKEGQALVSCLTGVQYPGVVVSGYVSDTPTNQYGAPAFQDVHIPAAGPAAVQFTGDGTVYIQDLQTDQGTSHPVSGTSGITVTLQPGFYRFSPVSGTQGFSYRARYGNFSYTYYDNAGRAVATVAPNGTGRTVSLVNPGFEQQQISTANATGWQHQGTSNTAYTENAHPAHGGTYYGVHWSGTPYAVTTYQDVSGLPNGLYTLRAWVRSTGGHNQAYLAAENFGGTKRQTDIPALHDWDPWQSVELTDIAVSNGQCRIEFFTDSPGNTWLFFDDVTLSPQNNQSLPSFVTRSTYGTSGQLLATESDDTGRSEYVYAKDGRIRFSQSALQLGQKRFSYSNYDEQGRVVESGEYQSTSATPSAVSVTQLEAENAAVAQTNARRVTTNVANASGGGDVEYLTATSTYVEFAVPIPQPTYTFQQENSYAVAIRYSAGGSVGTARTMSLYVNGTRLRQVVFPATGSWTQWATQTEVVSLPTGANTIKLQFDADDNGGINLDYLQVLNLQNGVAFESQLPLVIKKEAEAYYSSADCQCNTASNYSGFRGAGFVENLTVLHSAVVFTGITVPRTGSYTVNIGYAAALSSTRTMSLFVNGTKALQARFAPTYDWSAYDVLTVELPLTAGANTVSVKYDDGDNGTINLDYLDVVVGRTPTTTSVLNLVEDRTATGGLAAERCQQRSFVWYDTPFQDSQLNGRTQEFIQGAVSKTHNDNATTWYSYDELGRVTWMVQDLRGVGVKTLDYRYDFSGNVLEVAYQHNQTDAFHHYYEYDADQRLRRVYTSPDGVARTLQAKYDYYLHGGLKRTELADQLQGVDYLYTLQGALKSINHVNPRLDPGGDSPAQNGIPKDLFGLTLDYYDGDYVSRAQPALALHLNATDGNGNARVARYDGTVAATAWRTAASPDLHQIAYAYDEKGQLTQSDFGKLTVTGTPTAPTHTFGPDPAHPTQYEEGGLSYDANGNLGSLRRRNATGVLTDNFTYEYTANTNRLVGVHAPGAVSMGNPNLLDYDYDAIGQMTRERDGTQQHYFSYNVTGLVTGVFSDAARRRALVRYQYDDRGFRLSKIVYGYASAPVTTFYVRDASGNVLSTYEDNPNTGQPLQRIETPLYGAGRLGVMTRLDDGTDDARYELNDQRGDARVVFHRPTTEVTETDVEPTTSQADSQWPGLVQARQRTHPVEAHSGEYVAYVPAAPAGGSVESIHRTVPVLQGDTISFSAWARVFAVGQPLPRTARLRVLPFLTFGQKTAPTENVAGNASRPGLLNRLSAGIVLTGWGRKPGPAGKTLTTAQVWIRYRVLDESGHQVAEHYEYYANPGQQPWVQLQTGVRVAQAGSIDVTIGSDDPAWQAYFDDLRLEQTGGMIVQEQHQYAYGSPLVGLNYAVGNKRYRYGYQGQYAEKDAETGFESFELRLYNDRIGRWMSNDPEGQFSSPYVGMGNNSISVIDPTGGLGIWDKIKSFFGMGEKVAFTVPLSEVAVTGSRVAIDAPNWFRCMDVPGSFFRSSANAGDFVIKRFYLGKQSTLGTFEISGTNIKGYTLEPGGPPTTQSGQNKMVPDGSYDATMHRVSAEARKFIAFDNVMQLSNEQVPIDRAVLLHNGNKFSHSRGCVLLGSSYSIVNGEGEVSYSVKTVQKVLDYYNGSVMGKKIIITTEKTDFFSLIRKSRGF